jgi:large subunit ribosomal protein L22
MKASAHLRYLNISPRKVRIVVDALRGLKAEDALNKLRFIEKRAAYPLTKLVKSAIANAEHNLSLDRSTLRIEKFTVDGGPMLKRFRPKALGRVAPIQRKTSHVTIILEGERMSREKIKQRDKGSETVAETTKIETPEKKDSHKALSRDEKKFEVEKKVGQEKKSSFARRIFRRKSI